MKFWVDFLCLHSVHIVVSATNCSRNRCLALAEQPDKSLTVGRSRPNDHARKKKLHLPILFTCMNCLIFIYVWAMKSFWRKRFELHSKPTVSHTGSKYCTATIQQRRGGLSLRAIIGSIKCDTLWWNVSTSRCLNITLTGWIFCGSGKATWNFVKYNQAKYEFYTKTGLFAERTPPIFRNQASSRSRSGQCQELWALITRLLLRQVLESILEMSSQEHAILILIWRSYGDGKRVRKESKGPGTK